MIEIVFSESASESLKIAQKYRGTSSGCFMVTAPIGVIVHREIEEKQQPDPQEIQTMLEQAEREEKQRMEKAVPMGGNPADVYCLDMALSIGDISGDLFGESRAARLRQQLMTLRGTESWFSERLQNAAKTSVQFFSVPRRGKICASGTATSRTSFAGCAGCCPS